MTATYCKTCEGLGTVCNKCNIPWEAGSKLYGHDCKNRRRKDCPNHIEPTFICDICETPLKAKIPPNPNYIRKWVFNPLHSIYIDNKRFDVCGVCENLHKQAALVACDQFLEARAGIGNANTFRGERQQPIINYIEPLRNKQGEPIGEDWAFCYKLTPFGVAIELVHNFHQSELLNSSYPFETIRTDEA